MQELIGTLMAGNMYAEVTSGMPIAVKTILIIFLVMACIVLFIFTLVAHNYAYKKGFYREKGHVLVFSLIPTTILLYLIGMLNRYNVEKDNIN
jgi:uncharacterized membrane protein